MKTINRRGTARKNLAAGKGKKKQRLIIEMRPLDSDSGLELLQGASNVRIEIRGLSIDNLDEAYIERFKNILKSIYEKKQDIGDTANIDEKVLQEQPEALHRSVRDYNIIWNKIISERG